MHKGLCVSAAVAAGICLASLPASAQQQWKVTEGTVSFQLPRHILSDFGLSVSGIQQTATPRQDHVDALGFAITKRSDLKFESRGWSFMGWQGGQVVTDGGFTLKGPKGAIRLSNPTVVYQRTNTTDNLFIKAGPGASDLVVFDLSHIKIGFDRPSESILFGFADAILTDKAARLLGVPQWGGQIFGMVTVAGRTVFTGGDPNDAPPPSGGGIEGGGGVNGDVKLYTLGTCAQGGHIGTYPNGIVGMGMSTTSCNAAPYIAANTPANQDNVDWFDTTGGNMDQRHPVIPQNFYRKTPEPNAAAAGKTRFEQLGAGWVKHGFLSTNTPNCASPYTTGSGISGTHLYPGLTDTYGASLNYGQSYLGPRNEINPFTGWWTCTNSYFSNYQNDCVERFSTSGLGPIDHMLQVYDSDLASQPANTSFIYEACYISHDDTDRYNNAAWRTCVPTWNGSSWTFGSAGAQNQGVAIDKWGDIQPAPRAQPTTEGDILVAVQVSLLNNGLYHYEYAVYNHTSDRQMRTFSIPIGDEVTVTNVAFRDVDKEPTNDWTFVRANCAMTWSTADYATNPNANSLKWGTTYNFRFDANIAPVASTATCGLFKPGGLQTLAAVTQGPKPPFINPTTFSYTGGLLAGGLNDLFCNEDNKLILRPGAVLIASQPPATLTVESNVDTATPANFKFRIETSASLTNIQQTVEVKNFTTGLFDQIDQRVLGTSDGLLELPISNSADHIEAGTKKVIAKISFKATGPTLVYPWQARIDQTVWMTQ